MGWFNIYGMIFIIVIMIPNIIFAIKCKDGFNTKFTNKIIETIEQVGRYGCFALMIINIPYTYYGWWFNHADLVYLIIDSFLVIIYCIIWIICWNKNNVFKALSLSIIPSLIFLFSGIMLCSILLIIFSIIFSLSHIIISYINAIL